MEGRKAIDLDEAEVDAEDVQNTLINHMQKKKKHDFLKNEFLFQFSDFFQGSSCNPDKNLQTSSSSNNPDIAILVFRTTS